MIELEAQVKELQGASSQNVSIIKNNNIGLSTSTRPDESRYFAQSRNMSNIDVHNDQGVEPFDFSRSVLVQQQFQISVQFRLRFT